MNADNDVRFDRAPLLQELLHAMGQPLTALQMCVLLRDRPPVGGVVSVDLLGDMADQVLSLSRLFSVLRRVLDADRTSLRGTRLELERMTRDALPGWQVAARARNVRLTVTGFCPAPSQDEVHGREPALRSCLHDLVEAALESAADGEAVVVDLCATSGVLRLCGGPWLADTSFHAQFLLPLARALLDGGAQQFRYTLRPFEATLILASNPDSSAPLHRSSPHPVSCDVLEDSRP